ncbi:hypothetical protein GLW05_13310 [Pontibacillus yanchengensis]|uniref:Uncharacterized protein n=2 Tax=Pontibacillus yanchengensis TaxID=462910 RepID=A0A6I5A1N0_9BACI|nr:hypothetical protein [Pontibacillus yanchengensis]
MKPLLMIWNTLNLGVQQMSKIKDMLTMYFILESQGCKYDPISALQEAIRGGVTCFQYRGERCRVINWKSKRTVVDNFVGNYIGLSVHTLEEGIMANIEHIDYVGVGLIFSTSPKKPLGLKRFTLCAMLTSPSLW